MCETKRSLYLNGYGGDPASRGPMRWDLATSTNPELTWTKRLISLRKNHRSLRIGDFVPLDCDRLLGFVRRTDKALETVVVLVNPTDSLVAETVSCREGRLMNGGELRDVLDGSTVRSDSGFISVQVPPKSARVYELISPKGYTPYKRIY